MASQTLKQRHKDDQVTPTTTSAAAAAKNIIGSGSDTVNDTNNKRNINMAIARKGFRSLGLAVLLPLMLTVLAAYLSGCSVSKAQQRPIWHPPIWAFHVASISTASLMGLSAWLVWADGGFHCNPAMLLLYSAQLLLGLLWGPTVFGLGWARVGLVMCVLFMFSLFGCMQSFRKVNRVAADMVKPCLVCVTFLAVFNYELI